MLLLYCYVYAGIVVSTASKKTGQHTKNTAENADVPTPLSGHLRDKFILHSSERQAYPI